MEQLGSFVQQSMVSNYKQEMMYGLVKFTLLIGVCRVALIHGCGPHRVINTLIIVLPRKKINSTFQFLGLQLDLNICSKKWGIRS